MGNELNGDRGTPPATTIRAMGPNRAGWLGDQKIVVRHIMTAAAAMIAVATQPMSLKPSWT